MKSKRGDAFMNTIDEIFVMFLAEHFKNVDSLFYTGPVDGAHRAEYFCRPRDLPKQYSLAKLMLSSLKITAGLYNEPHRTLESMCSVWCLATDFDFDRGEMSRQSRLFQESILYEFCNRLSPSYAVRTRNGYHLYWVLARPIPWFDYAYPASMINAAIHADEHSLIPSQCLNIVCRDKHKPGIPVSTMLFETANKSLDIGLCRAYEVESIVDTITNGRAGSTLQRFYKTMSVPVRAQINYADSRYNKRVDETNEIVEHIDLVMELRGAGLSAYRSGNKILLNCPYHEDTRPSAFINLNSMSEYYGMMFCTSASCGVKVTLKRLLRDMGIYE